MASSTSTRAASPSTPRIAGRVDRVYADFTGIQVKKRDHLVDLYSPDLVVAQGELVRAIESRQKSRFDQSFAEANVEVARADRNRVPSGGLAR